jgi:hypothetical protein
MAPLIDTSDPESFGEFSVTKPVLKTRARDILQTGKGRAITEVFVSRL